MKILALAVHAFANAAPLLALLALAFLLGGCALGRAKKAQRQQLAKARAAAVQAVAQPGDVIFIDVPSPLFRQVSKATACRTNHVGILFRDERRGWVVAESAVPLSRVTPLRDFLARSADAWCAVRRLRGGLTAEQARALRTASDARMGRLYHTGFRYDSPRLFCSKFVHDVYAEALGKPVGELEIFGNLLRRQPGAKLAFWHAWFLGRIPWERRTVTPASQFESAKLQTVWAAEVP